MTAKEGEMGSVFIASVLLQDNFTDVWARLIVYLWTEGDSVCQGTASSSAKYQTFPVPIL